ncbi:hypothetical protein K402DRAFT_420409 [Aulographum hederae CBS 113979]|uniref:Protein sip5 n=1 Tax=Aulographum hederae CBS 113979 TaxID=1176131 RepID=A0A6G1H1X5_9PEZI|nr:hypothetical protein K402DRAFT_420409 [Aulographum hederae CBS 113979]
MGNSSSKDGRGGSSSHHGPGSNRNGDASNHAGASGSSSHPAQGRIYSSRGSRGSRHDISNLLSIVGNADREPAQPERRETRVEREQRKLEKERVARAKERERSVKEEGVDGGYLVTLGTYTGPEDFGKAVVRQLMIERRLAPFWKGLNDHSESWTEHQLVAVVRGLPLPPADEIPPEDPPRSPSTQEANPRSSDMNINHLTVPISSRSPSYTSEANLSPSHPAFSYPGPNSPFGSPPSSNPFFRGRAKTLAALTTSSKNNSQAEMTPQEMQLPKDPFVNGQQLEAFLYKDASECPICFLYYPPYLNKTRCCDQPICSECFVQIKRSDPHPPEHHDANGNPVPIAEVPNDGAPGSNIDQATQLVSEPAACPFCVQPEFGVTYEPPPFRRGLTYGHSGHPLANATSAMSSSSSLASGLNSPASRRRTTSISASAPSVITTDRVRPDWAKKLSDARAHAMRRAAAATALHNAAYVLGNQGGEGGRAFGLGRRRRTMLFGDIPGPSGNGNSSRTPEELNLSQMGAMLAAAGRTGGSIGAPDGGNDLFPGRGSSRSRQRVEDIEELMIMEAVRLSLAAEEERKKKEEKESAKREKKEKKEAAKAAKKASKGTGGIKTGFHPLNPEGMESRSSQATSSMSTMTPSSSRQMPPADDSAGKGKGVDRPAANVALGFNPLSEPTSTLNTEMASQQQSPQQHLEQSRAQVQAGAAHSSEDTAPRSNSGQSLGADLQNHRQVLRNMSTGSDASSLSSFADNSLDASPHESGLDISSNPEARAASGEPMINFGSLAAVMDAEENKEDEAAMSGSRHIERADESSGRSRGDSGNSEGSSNAHIENRSPPPRLPQNSDLAGGGVVAERDDSISALRHTQTQQSDPFDAKHYGDRWNGCNKQAFRWQSMEQNDG